MRNISIFIRQFIRTTVFKDFNTIFIIQILGAFLFYVLHVYLAKSIGVYNYGILVFLFSFIKPIAVLSNVGFKNSIVKFVPHYIEKQQFGEIKGFLIFSYFIITIVSIFAIIMYNTVFYFVNLADYPFVLILYSSILILFLSINEQSSFFFKSLKKFKFSLIPSMVLYPLLVIVLIYLFLDQKSDVSQIFIFYIISSFMVLTIYVIGIRKTSFLVNSYTKLTDGKQWFKISFPMLLSNVSFFIISRSDLIIIGILLGPKYVGIYNIAARTVELMDFILISVNSAVAPDFSRIFSKNDINALQRKFFNSRLFIFWLSLAFAIILIFFRPYIWVILGKEFHIAIMPFYILIIGKLVSAYCGSSGVFLNMVGLQKQHFYLNLISAGLSIMFNLILIPNLGLVGVALTYLISISFINITKLRFAKRKLKYNSSTFGMLFRVS